MIRAGLGIALGILLACPAVAAPVKAKGARPGQACAMIEDFNLCPVGSMPWQVDVSAIFSKKQEYSVRISASGYDGSNCLNLERVGRGQTATRLVLGRALDLGGCDGIRFQARASAPGVSICIIMQGGDGMLFWDGALDTSWKEYVLVFEEAQGWKRFDRRKISRVSFSVVSRLSALSDVLIDSLSGYRLPGKPERIGINMRSIGFITGIPNGYNHPLQHTAPVKYDSEGLLQYAIWTDPEVAVASSSNYKVNQLGLPSAMTGYAGIRMDLKLESAAPKAILKYWVSEISGERFVALRDAPTEFTEIYIPFSEFVPDTALNDRLSASAVDGKLDLAAVDGWGVEVIPLGEEYYRGMIFIKDAWGVKR